MKRLISRISSILAFSFVLGLTVSGYTYASNFCQGDWKVATSARLCDGYKVSGHKQLKNCGTGYSKSNGQQVHSKCCRHKNSKVHRCFDNTAKMLLAY